MASGGHIVKTLKIGNTLCQIRDDACRDCTQAGIHRILEELREIRLRVFTGQQADDDLL